MGKQIGKFFGVTWQIILFPLLFIPYMWLNGAVIVEIFGCGCPQIAPDGTEVIRNFNANDFTFLFWCAVGAIVLIISLFQMKKLRYTWQRFLLIASMILGSAFFINIFSVFMRWK